MRILILSWRGPGHPHEGGAEKVTHRYAKYWVQAGHDVTLFTSSFTDSIPEETIDGVRVIRSGSQAFGVKFSAFYWYLFKNRDDFDLVIDHFHGIPFFTPLYVRAKKVAFIHEVATKVWSLNTWPKPLNLLPSIVGRLGEPLVFRLYGNCEFLTVSNSTRKDIINFGVKDKFINVIHNGVDINTKRTEISHKKSEHFTVTFLGALAKDKGIEDALIAFSQSYKKDSSLRMWVIGKGLGEYVKQLKVECKRLGIDGAVKFWGFVSESKKSELLSRTHLLINLSIHEGWGLVNIEANCFGVPVLGYKVSGTVDSVVDGKTGVLFEKGDTGSVSDEILNLKKNRDKYSRLSLASKDWSKKFSWDSSLKKSLELIKKYE